MKWMKPTSVAAVVLSCALLGIAGILSFNGLSHKSQPSIDNLLGVSQSAEQVQLYPVGVGNVSTAHEFLKGLVVGFRPFDEEQKTDGDTVDIYKRTDKSVEFTLEWYPAPAHAVRRLKVATVYGADGRTVIGQVSFRPDGTRELRGILLDNGNYQTTTYYGDGIARADLTIVGRSTDKWDDTKYVLNETRWYQDGKVSFTSVFNQDDKAQDIVKLDENGEQLEVAHLTRWTDGSKLVEYYPGTKNVRIKADSSIGGTNANFYRPDGTLAMFAQIFSSSASISLYDATGKKEVRQEILMFDRVETNGIGHIANARLYVLTEENDQSIPTREWTWTLDGKRIWKYEAFNVLVPNPTAGQPPILCKSVAYFYSDDGTLNDVMYSPADGKVQSWDVKGPASNARPPAPPAEMLVLPQLDPDLPVPYPQSGGE